MADNAHLKQQGYSVFEDGSDGYFFVQEKDKKGKLWAVFNESGKQLTPFSYNQIEPYNQGYAIAGISIENIENKYFAGKKDQDPPTEDNAIIYALTSDKYVMCLLDKSGQVHNNTYYGKVILKEDHVYHFYASGYGYLTSDGFYMPPQFNNLSLLTNGYFRIKKGLDKDKNYTYAIIDKKGDYIITPDTYIALGLMNEHGATLYIKQNPFESGYIDIENRTFVAKEVKDKFLYVDPNGQLAPISKPGDIRKSIENAINFTGANGKYGFHDDEGNIFISAMYDSSSSCFWGGLAFVKKDGKWGFIDRHNNEITPIMYDSVGFIAPGYGQALLDGVMYLIGSNGVIASKKGGYFGHKAKRLDPKTNEKRYSCGIDFIWYILYSCWYAIDSIDGKTVCPYSEDLTYMKYDEVTKLYYFETGKNKGVTIDGKAIEIEEEKELDEKSEMGEKATLALQELYGNKTIPALWSELLYKSWAWKSRFSRGITPAVTQKGEFRNTLRSWFNTNNDASIEELARTFYYIADADSTGSFYAYFVTDESASFDEAPIVFLGSEGELNMVADNLSELLQLISIDTEPVGNSDMDKSEMISFYKNIEEEESECKGNYINWLKEKGIKPIVVKNQLDEQPKGAQSIVKKANKQHFKALLGIYNKYFR